MAAPAPAVTALPLPLQTAMAFPPAAPHKTPKAEAPVAPVIVPPKPPAWRRYAVAAPDAEGKPTLTVVIAAMGLDPTQSARAVALPGPLALAWAPEAPHLAAQVAVGTARGHEALLDMPMEGFGRPEPDPETLRTWLPPAANLARLRTALDRVPTAMALDPREGGIAMLSVPLMGLVMAELAARRMAFLDGPALTRSVARGRAEAAGLPVLAPDMLIDGDANPAMMRVRLLEAETIARRQGHAIVEGRARPATLDVLEQYLPTLAARGFALRPVSAAIGAVAQGGRAAAAPPAGPAIRTAAGVAEPIGEAAIAPAQRSGAE